MPGRSDSGCKAAQRRSSPAKLRGESLSRKVQFARNWKTSIPRLWRYAGREGFEEPIRGCSLLTVRRLPAELFCVLGIQTWPIELHRFTANDSPERVAGKESIEHIDADVPARPT